MSTELVIARRSRIAKVFPTREDALAAFNAACVAVANELESEKHGRICQMPRGWPFESQEERDRIAREDEQRAFEAGRDAAIRREQAVIDAILGD